MGSAIIKGLVGKKIIDPKDLIISDINEERVRALKNKLQIEKDAKSNIALVKDVDAILLAVKPQVVKKVLKEIGPSLKNDSLVISIVAGVPMALYEATAGKNFPLARVMPNTPALINMGVSCVSFNSLVSEEQKSDCIEILGAIGNVHEVAEKHLDAVTGLSGSGPAYVFYVLEGLIDGGVKMGLPRDLARALAIDTILGSVTLAKETGKQPMELKDQVTSPGGTTIEALQSLEDGNVKGTLMRAVETATLKSKKLSAMLK